MTFCLNHTLFHTGLFELACLTKESMDLTTMDHLEVDLNSNHPLDFSVIFKLTLEDR